jgi:2-isopropylmalate synthase
VECTINGIGERAGNAALEEVAVAIKVRPDRLPYESGIRHEMIFPTSQLLSELISFAPQPNKAIVGRNAFAHEAGIHQHGVLSNPLCYEIMTPESVGVPASQLVLGKHSGRHALANRYQELGHTISNEELEIAYQRFSQIADRRKNIYDQDLLSLLQEIRGREQSFPAAAAAQL